MVLNKNCQQNAACTNRCMHPSSDRERERDRKKSSNVKFDFELCYFFFFVSFHFIYFAVERKKITDSVNQIKYWPLITMNTIRLATVETTITTAVAVDAANIVDAQ